MVEVFPRLLPPLWVTIKVSFISLFLAFFIGLFFGSINSVFSKLNPINLVSRFYVWIVLCTPIIIQIYAAYLLLPKIGIKLDVFWVGVIALTFNSAGYQIEISRASITSIDKGQYEASKTLGMGLFTTMIYIIIPQAIKRMLPATANEVFPPAATSPKDPAAVVHVGASETPNKAVPLLTALPSGFSTLKK